MEDLATSAEVDATDPAVMVIAWGLTYAVGRWCPPDFETRVRPILPVVALLAACGARAAIDATQGEPLTLEALLRAVAAAGVAVMGHSQVREVHKAVKRRGGEDGGT